MKPIMNETPDTAQRPAQLVVATGPLFALERLLSAFPEVREVYLSPLRYCATDKEPAEYQCEVLMGDGRIGAYRDLTLEDVIGRALKAVEANIADEGRR